MTVKYNYEDQTVLVTGAASGIGQAQMLAYLAAGAWVIALDKKLIQHQHDRLVTYQVNLTDEGAVNDVMSQILSTYSIDILLNTAGQLDDWRTLSEIALSDFHQIMATNLMSMVQLSQLILPQMLARKSGHILNMASIAGLIAGGGGVAYTTSKHAIVGFTKQMAHDYAKDNIHVNAIAPGAIDTPMNQADFANGGQIAQEVAQQTPAKRWAKPDEVARLSLFLTSEGADYIHGAIYEIDGGWLVR